MSREIPLQDGRVAIVDDDDFAWLSGWSWSTTGNYVCRGEGGKTIRLHRVILPPPEGMVVDHINGDPLDNRRANLRVATVGENNTNRRANKGAQYKAIMPFKGGWRASVRIEGRHVWTRTFLTMEGAAFEYDILARLLNGEFARLNFPELLHLHSHLTRDALNDGRPFGARQEYSYPAANPRRYSRSAGKARAA